MELARIGLEKLERSRNGSVAPSVRGNGYARSDVDESVYDDPGTPASSCVVSTPRKVGQCSLSADSPGLDTAAGSDEEEDVRRSRPMRQARINSKPLQWHKRPPSRKQRSQAVTHPLAAMDTADDTIRCVTCACALEDREWDPLTSWAEFCPRCYRHAIVFQLPWPAHRAQDVREYPPAHLIPSGYWPRKVTSVALPTLNPVRGKKTATEPEPVEHVYEQTLIPESREMRRARNFRLAIEREECVIEQLRVAAWEQQETRELAIIAAAERREAAKRAREEARRKRNEGKIRGSGLWQRYEYQPIEEIEKRIRERTTVVSGTRRGGRYRQDSDEEDLARRAQEALNAEIRKEKELQERNRRYRKKEQGESSDEEAAAQSADERDEQEAAASLEPVQPLSTWVQSPQQPTLGLSSRQVDRPTTPRASPKTAASIKQSPKSLPRAGARHTPLKTETIDLTASDGEEDVKKVAKAPANATTATEAKTRPPAQASPAPTQATNDTPVSRRKRGRPPGTGYRQKREAKRLEREARQREIMHTAGVVANLAKGPNGVFPGARPAANTPVEGSATRTEQSSTDTTPSQSLSAESSQLQRQISDEPSPSKPAAVLINGQVSPSEPAKWGASRVSNAINGTISAAKRVLGDSSHLQGSNGSTSPPVRPMVHKKHSNGRVLSPHLREPPAPAPGASADEASPPSYDDAEHSNVLGFEVHLGNGHAGPKRKRVSDASISSTSTSANGSNAAVVPPRKKRTFFKSVFTSPKPPKSVQDNGKIKTHTSADVLRPFASPKIKKKHLDPRDASDAYSLSRLMWTGRG